MKPLFKNPSRAFSVFTWLVFAVGVVVRWFYVIKWHDPRRYIYSDMAMYVELAKQIAPPDYVLTTYHVTHPPGTVWLMLFFFGRDPTMMQHVYFNFVICSLVPLAVGALGWVAFDRRCGQISLIIASSYFAFIDFGGYFLAEIHIAFVATTTIVLYLLANKIAEGPPSPKRTLAFTLVAVVGGIFFSFAMTLKMVAILTIGALCLVHLVFTKCPQRLVRASVLGIFLVSAMPLTGYVANRCTKANEGHFCSGSNKSAADFLLGHYGRIGGIEWRDPKTGVVFIFGSPAASQHSYPKTEKVPFGITDQPANNKEAWSWIGKHPDQAVILSVEHVWDAFGGSYPWPTNMTPMWTWSYGAHYAFLFLVIVPAVILLVDVLRDRGVMGLLRSMELAVFSPIIGLCSALFLATGEIRYRVPWDGMFIVLAVELYRRARGRRRLDRPATAADSAAS